MNANETKREKKGYPWGRLIPEVLLFVLVVLPVLPFVRQKSEPSRTVFAVREVHVIRHGLIQYIAKFGGPPIGDQAQIWSALRGKNPGQIVFFEGLASRFNARGEYVDPWKNPYQIDVSNAEWPKVYSFGRNGVDEGGAVGSDDVVSWR